MAMHVHGMHGDVEVVDDDTDAGVTAEIIDVPVGVVWVGVVLLGRKEEDGVVVVGAEGLVVEQKDVVAGGIGFEIE